MLTSPCFQCRDLSEKGTQTYIWANTAAYHDIALNVLQLSMFGKCTQRYTSKIKKKKKYLWQHLLPVWSICKCKHTSITSCTFTPTAASLISSAHPNFNRTSSVSPSSSFSLILFTCCRRRSQYNLSSDILVFSASVFSWSSATATANEPAFGWIFTVFYNRKLAV